MRGRPLRRLYHLTPAANVASIRRDGLLSTHALLDRSGADEALRRAVLGWRAEPAPLPDGVVIGDQWCQPPERLERCLLGGLTPQDWYDRLNGFAYLWPSEAAARKHAGTYASRDQAVLVFDAEALLAAHGGRAFVTTFNVGYAMRRAKPRDMTAFTPLAAYAGPVAAVREVLIEGGVRDAARFLIGP